MVLEFLCCLGMIVEMIAMVMVILILFLREIKILWYITIDIHIILWVSVVRDQSATI